MLSTRTIRVVAITALLSTGILTSGLVNVTSASAATPKLVVTPSTGLTNHKTVTVSGTGFKPKDQVYITECQANAKGEAGCDIFLADAGEDHRRGRPAQDEVQGGDRHHR